jgi:predicted PurR-regulated permease PerM
MIAFKSYVKKAVTAPLSSAAHEVSKDAGKVVGSELKTAASGVVHEATDVAVARAKASGKWKTKLAGSGPMYIGATATALTGGYVVWNTNQRVDQLANAAKNLGKNAQDDINKLLDHMPRPGDIEGAALRAVNGAHDIGAGLAGPASTALTISLVLGSMVVAYEVYKYSRLL